MKNSKMTITKKGNLYYILDENNLPIRKTNYAIPTNQLIDRWNDLTFTTKKEAVIYCKLTSRIK